MTQYSTIFISFFLSFDVRLKCVFVVPRRYLQIVSKHILKLHEGLTIFESSFKRVLDIFEGPLQVF